MKKLLLSTLLLFLPLLASAYDIAVKNTDRVTIYYNYIKNNRELEVTYETTDYNSYSGEVNIPEVVSYDGIILPVTCIGDEAFFNCYELTSVTIPSSVTSIDEGAFDGCFSLTSVHITDLAAWCNIVFYNESSSPLSYGGLLVLNGEEIKDLVIPNSVTFIRDNAFVNYCNLTSVILPNSVTYIGNNAFANCYNLTSLTLPNSVTDIGDNAFGGCGLTSVTLPNSVTDIGENVFANCNSLTSVTIPNSVTDVGKNAFSGCSGLSSVHITDLAAWCNIVFYDESSNPLSYGGHLFLNGEEVKDLVIPNSVIDIGACAFWGCEGLTSVTIGNSVVTIGNHAFRNCCGLTSATIGNSVTTIGNGAFDNCSSLISATIGNSVTTIGDNAFWGCEKLTSVTLPNSLIRIGYQAFYKCSSLTSVAIPNSVTTIDTRVFYECSNLTSATIGNSVTTIGTQGFQGCEKLTSVNIPSSVTSIGTMAFYGCTSLASVTIPNSVISIGNNAFRGCSSLSTVFSRMKNPCSIDYYCFNQDVFDNATLYVPGETKEKYESTSCWYLFLNKVEGEPIVTSAKAATESIPVQISAQDGVIMVTSEQEGLSVALYSIDGRVLGTAKVNGGQAIIDTYQSKGTIVVVKVGDRSVKVKL